jgi:TrmH family RNA methyltransferase
MPRSLKSPGSLPAVPAADWAHVVLVEPGDSLNVGAVARAMMNLGFRHLHLVAPPSYDRERAAASACWATPILNDARLHATLEEALAEMEQVVGFSARHGHDRPRHLLLDEWCARVAAEPAARTALLFGPEDHGLHTEHLTHCRWLVRIPSSEANPSFNLAQSVLLVLFELSRPGWSAIPRENKRRPTIGRHWQLDLLVETVLRQVGYFGKGTPRPIPRLVKHLIRRIDPDERELGVLMGLFGKIHRALAGRVPIHAVEPEHVDPPADGSKA